MDVLTYVVRSITSNGEYIIWELQGGAAVNEYTAFLRGDVFVLYPRRKLIPSTVLLDKKTVHVNHTKRGF